MKYVYLQESYLFLLLGLFMERWVSSIEELVGFHSFLT
jgi:hypothetical protein